MSDAVIVGLLSLLGTCIGSWGGLRLMSYRIEQLEKKVDKHNNFAARMPVVEEQIKVINHRITDLEQEHHE
jgi:hypothetical protein|nr:MAG TPA: hypothetical protein [Caudoviricetes sp.]